MQIKKISNKRKNIYIEREPKTKRKKKPKTQNKPKKKKKNKKKTKKTKRKLGSTLAFQAAITTGLP
jgi:hypothetical protein